MFMAEKVGVEPTMSESKSDVFPLHYFPRLRLRKVEITSVSVQIRVLGYKVSKGNCETFDI